MNDSERISDRARRRSELFRAFIGALTDRGIPYCIVGDYEKYPNEISSDVDFVVLPEHLGAIYQVVNAAAEATGAKVVQALRHETSACYFVVVNDSEDTLVFLHPDSSSDFRRKGRVWLAASELLNGRRCHPNGFLIPAVENEFIYYLIKRIDKGSISDSHAKHMVRLLDENSEACIARAQKIWSKSGLQRLVEQLRRNDLGALRRELGQLAIELHNSPCQEGVPSRLIQEIRDVARKVDRIIHPTGLFVVVMGPDGSGKSSVIERIAMELEPAFRRTSVFHLRVRRATSKGETRVPVERPHAAENWNWTVSIIKIAYLLFQYVLGYAHFTIPSLIRSTLVILDRYYYDVLVDPRRFRYGGPMWWAKLVAGLIPKPDVLILLDAPAEVLQARKQEVAFEESARQRLAYLRVMREFPMGVILDASRPLDEVAREARSVILDTMAKRVAQRMRASQP